MKGRRIVLAMAAALALVAGGTAAGAAIASGPVDSAGVIHGCITSPDSSGLISLHLVGAGTPCPAGMTAITWNQTGPAGATGPAGPPGNNGAQGPPGATGAPGPTGPAGPIGNTGPAGPAGAPGPTGPAGPQGPIGNTGPPGPAGANGNTVLSGTGAPATSVGNDGDFYIDTSADVLYGPKAGGSWPATGTSLVGAPGATGPAGPQGPQGPAGPQGPPGSGGVSSVTDLNGITCTTDGGAAGTVTVGTDGNNTVVLTCNASPTDANCTHSTGVATPPNYTDCNDLAGTPGVAGPQPTAGTGYTSGMAIAAAQAYFQANLPGSPQAEDNLTGRILTPSGSTVPPRQAGTVHCVFHDSAGFPHEEFENVVWSALASTGASGTTIQLTMWDFGPPVSSPDISPDVIGHVHQQTFTLPLETTFQDIRPECVTSADPTWN